MWRKTSSIQVKASSIRALLRRGLLVTQDEVHWVRDDLKITWGETLAVQARIRYRQPLEKATLYCEKEGLFVLFDSSTNCN